MSSEHTINVWGFASQMDPLEKEISLVVKKQEETWFI